MILSNPHRAIFKCVSQYTHIEMIWVLLWLMYEAVRNWKVLTRLTQPSQLLTHLPKMTRGVSLGKRRTAFFVPFLLDSYGGLHCGVSFDAVVPFTMLTPRGILCKCAYGNTTTAARCFIFNKSHNTFNSLGKVHRVQIFQLPNCLKSLDSSIRGLTVVDTEICIFKGFCVKVVSHLNCVSQFFRWCLNATYAETKNANCFLRFHGSITLSKC